MGGNEPGSMAIALAFSLVLPILIPILGTLLIGIVLQRRALKADMQRFITIKNVMNGQRRR
jgi:hypothetical protein